MGRCTVKEACGKPAEAAVAERAIFDILHDAYIDAAKRKKVLHIIEQAEVKKVVIDHAAGQILGGDVVRPASALTGAAASAPVIRDSIHDGIGECAVQLLGIGFVEPYLIIVAEDILRAAYNALCVH